VVESNSSLTSAVCTVAWTGSNFRKEQVTPGFPHEGQVITSAGASCYLYAYYAKTCYISRSQPAPSKNRCCKMASERIRHLSPRLRDIAERAGVSVNTVSRALNDKPDISAATRERVRAIAKTLGYTPNKLARSLLRGRSETLGLVVTDCTDPYYSALIRAVESAAAQRGFGLLLTTSDEDVGKEVRGLSQLLEHRVDGVLLVPVDVTAKHVSTLLNSGRPVVLLSRRPPDYLGGFVGTDNFLAAELAVAHLVKLGHTRIARLDRTGTASSAEEIRRGFRHALSAAGITEDPTRTHCFAPTIEGGRAAAAWLLGLQPLPTAVVTNNDAQAIGLIHDLQDAGVSVPGNISIIGFNDIALSSLVRPPLTTVAHPIREIGTLGAERLIDYIEGSSRSTTAEVLAPRLVIRESTAPPPARATA